MNEHWLQMESRIHKTLDCIEQRLTATILIDDLSDLACYSKFHFLRLFSSITGQTVGDYIRKRRLSQAAIDLVTSDATIIEIALRYQFESQAAFTRSFQKQFEVTPGKYRKLAHKFVPFERYQLSREIIKTLLNDTHIMEPEIRIIAEKKLVGMNILTTLQENKTTELWKTFMPRRKEINHTLDTGHYAIQRYPTHITFETMTSSVLFEKWAAIEVETFQDIPEGMETLLLPSGTYAVFVHHGPVSTFPKTLQYIFKEWLPNSKYVLANHPHFEVMGENYFGPTHPNSEEEVWIPLK